MRMSVREFAAKTGIGARTITRWSTESADSVLSHQSMAVLDSLLDKAEAPTVALFKAHSAGTPTPAGRRAPGDAELDSWAEDLDRAWRSVYMCEFDAAVERLAPWRAIGGSLLAMSVPAIELYGRTLMIFGQKKAQLGDVLGLDGAYACFSTARSAFIRIDAASRAAVAELHIAACVQMTGQAGKAAEMATALTGDGRLSTRDRARAVMFAGQAAGKLGVDDHGASRIAGALAAFIAMGDAEMTSTAHAKLALALRVTDPDAAVEHITAAAAIEVPRTPLTRVQLAAATGHVLAGRPDTAEEGLQALAAAHGEAVLARLGHQAEAIGKLRTASRISAA
jgi:hypothetical protein